MSQSKRDDDNITYISMTDIKEKWYEESKELDRRLRDHFEMEGGKRTTPNIMELHPQYKAHKNQENVIRTTMLDYLQVNASNGDAKDESSTISMNVADKGELLEELETKMADIIGMKQVWLTSSGALANISLLRAILTKGLNVFYDQCVHMSVQCILTQNKNINIYKFTHNNIKQLRYLVKGHGSGLIITEGAFSHDGSIPDLETICKIKEESECMLLVDESHSIGLYGTNGGGIMAEKGLISRVDFMTASLSKAWSCPSLAVIAINDEKLTNFFEMNSLHAFSHAVPRLLLNRLRDVWTFYTSKEKLEEKKNKMKQLITYANQCIQKKGLQEWIKMDHPILAFPQYPKLCHEKTIYKIQCYLIQKCDVFAAIMCSPAWKKPFGMIRIALNVDMNEERIKKIIETINECREKFQFDDANKKTSKTKKNKCNGNNHKISRGRDFQNEFNNKNNQLHRANWSNNRDNRENNNFHREQMKKNKMNIDGIEKH